MTCTWRLLVHARSLPSSVHLRRNGDPLLALEELGRFDLFCADAQGCLVKAIPALSTNDDVNGARNGLTRVAALYDMSVYVQRDRSRLPICAGRR